LPAWTRELYFNAPTISIANNKRRTPWLLPYRPGIKPKPAQLFGDAFQIHSREAQARAIRRIAGFGGVQLEHAAIVFVRIVFRAAIMRVADERHAQCLVKHAALFKIDAS
jgi:hypothetical protein